MRLNTTSLNIRRHGKRIILQLLGAAALALSLAVLPTSSAQALTPNVKNATDHYFHCLGLLLSDPVAHATECGPNLSEVSNKSLSEPVIGGLVCGPNQILLNGACAPAPIECPSGEHESGGSCVPNEETPPQCGEGETYGKSGCVPICEKPTFTQHGEGKPSFKRRKHSHTPT